MIVNEEQKKQTQFTVFFLLITLVAMCFVFYLTKPLYEHPMPEKDCSDAYAYPMCKREVTPSALPPPTPSSVYLASIGMLVGMLFLLYFGYRATVTKQVNIVTSLAGKGGGGSQSNSPPSQQQNVQGGQPPQAAPPAQQVPAQAPNQNQSSQARPGNQTEYEGTDAWGHKVPSTIYHNNVAAEDVVWGPPKEQAPQQQGAPQNAAPAPVQGQTSQTAVQQQAQPTAPQPQVQQQHQPPQNPQPSQTVPTPDQAQQGGAQQYAQAQAPVPSSVPASSAATGTPAQAVQPQPVPQSQVSSAQAALPPNQPVLPKLSNSMPTQGGGQA